jgi:hypothetical protein
MEATTILVNDSIHMFELFISTPKTKRYYTYRFKPEMTENECNMILDAIVHQLAQGLQVSFYARRSCNSFVYGKDDSSKKGLPLSYWNRVMNNDRPKTAVVQMLDAPIINQKYMNLVENLIYTNKETL